jgi:hypothetical protein
MVERVEEVRVEKGKLNLGVLGIGSGFAFAGFLGVARPKVGS